MKAGMKGFLTKMLAVALVLSALVAVPAMSADGVQYWGRYGIRVIYFTRKRVVIK
jgi:hypothetical protein